MWGYTCGNVAGAICQAANPGRGSGWSPVVITVPYQGSGSATSLTINLTNNLAFTAGSGTNTVPTSLVIAGQLGGGLGSNGTKVASPFHTPGAVTWPTPSGAVTITNPGSGYTSAPTVSILPGAGDTTGAGAKAVATINRAMQTVVSISVTDPGSGYTVDPIVQISTPNSSTGTQATATLSLAAVTAGADPINVPTPQMPRVQSFGTEVPAGDPATNTTALTWKNLKPGTYLLESGTHPSIQVPMGLYGVVVVTANSQAYPTTSGLPTTAASAFDDQLALLLSEIDPVQNNAVHAAVQTAGFSETRPWSGLAPSGCGYPGAAGAPN
jgi:hypothetical protein